MTEWICVLNELSFDSAAYPDIVCLRKDTFKKTQIYKKHINMKRKYKKEMEGVNHNVNTFMH